MQRTLMRVAGKIRLKLAATLIVSDFRIRVNVLMRKRTLTSHIMRVCTYTVARVIVYQKRK